MGTDIHMFLVKKGETKLATKSSELFEGRNSEWFDDICGRGFKPEYDHLPANWWEEDEERNKNKQQALSVLEEACPQEDGYYGHSAMLVSDYIHWYNTYLPFLDAGYLSPYEKWMYEVKSIVPENISHYKDSDDEDSIFVPNIKVYCCDDEVIGNIKKFVDFEDYDNYYVVYCFDC